mgnify:CR=1 FL=1
MPASSGRPSRLAIALVVSALMPGAVNAYSNAADYVADQQAAQGCRGGIGTFSQLWETDLTGDGRPDLVIDHANLRCGSGESSELCGASTCEAAIYVRKGQLLKRAFSIYGSIDKLGGGRIRVMEYQPAAAGPGRARILKWNGSRFK